MEYFVRSKLVPPKEPNPVLLNDFIRYKNKINSLYNGYFKEKKDGEIKNGEKRVKELELERKLDACLDFAARRKYTKKVQEIEELNQDYCAQKTKIWTKNIGLVIQLARKLSNGNGLIDDLIQDGSEGIFIAAKKYNPNKNTKFSTYATYWIRQCMQNAINKNYKNSIVKPIGIEIHLAKLKRDYQGYSEKQNRNSKNGARKCSSDFERITAYDIKKCLGINNSNALRIIAALKTSHIHSLDDINEDGDFYLSELIGNEDKISDVGQNRILDNCIPHLNEKEQDIIRLRYGPEMCTLDKVGKMYNVTRERIRQIETKALRKLKILYQNGTLSKEKR